jgi:hypothetical protein
MNKHPIAEPMIVYLVAIAPLALHAQVNYAVSGNSAYVTNSPDAMGDIIIASTYKGYPVLTIGDWAFWNTALTSVTIPDSVSNIGDYAFASFGLSNIMVDAHNPFFSSLSGVLFNKNQTAIIQYPIGLTNASYTIPDNVITVGEGAFFYDTALTGVTIPDSVTNIRGGAFATTGLAHITIPDSVISIGEGAFEACRSLTNVTLGHGVTIIGREAFADTVLTTVNIPDAVTTIGPGTFASSGLSSVTIGKSAANIGDYAFAQCFGLTNILVDALNPEYSSLGGVLFDKDQTTLIQYPIGLTNASYAIPDSVTSVADSAFERCTNLTRVSFAQRVANIGDYAFAGTALTTVTIPDAVTNIGAWAFSDSRLTSVIIGKGIASIGAGAFSVRHRETIT